MEKIKIGIQSYEYSCGDGCCYEQGDNIFINGERIGDIPNGSAECALHLVLAHLGYEVEIEGLDTNEEVTWTM
jgi:hypothetical protein